MGTTLVITFREFLEMLIIIVPLIVYVYKINRQELQKFIFAGCGTGLILSILSGAFLINGINSLEGMAQKLFFGGTLILLAVLILYQIVWIGRKTKNITLDVNSKFDIKLKGTSLFILAAVTIFRESLEIIVFLLPTMSQNPLNITIGILLGVLFALVLMVIMYKTTIKLNLNLIFAALTVFLIIIGGHLFGEGLVEFVPENESIEMAGQLIYSIPLLFLFLKRELKKYMRKNKI
ncbi:hypothetical protein SH2C18_33530 [Clostridium sediminicola]|uniref:FTR1 family iron permease n=1 Tax=Clostridium sediminicola TaxID=3114879 RepID=UPI0031F24B1C